MESEDTPMAHSASSVFEAMQPFLQLDMQYAETHRIALAGVKTSGHNGKEWRMRLDMAQVCELLRAVDLQHASESSQLQLTIPPDKFSHWTSLRSGGDCGRAKVLLASSKTAGVAEITVSGIGVMEEEDAFGDSALSL